MSLQNGIFGITFTKTEIKLRSH